MQELFGQLGINVPMLIAQAVNFAVLLAVLTLFVYRPLMRTMEERREKIELGVKGAEIAEQKIAEAEQSKAEKIKEADKEAVKIIGQAEQKASSRSQELIAAAHEKSEGILAEAAEVAERKKIEELEKLSREAGSLVREAIAKAVSSAPETIDDKLVEQAAALIKKSV